MLAATAAGAMARSLRDSVVVITGASSGIGRATARTFALRGSTLVLTARRPLLLSEVATECQQLGAKALAAPLDVTDEYGLCALARKAVETFGHLDVWFNNAGVGVIGKLEEIPPEALHKAMETNLMSCIYGARACLPHFRKQGHGVLMNNGCLLAEGMPELMTLYATAKWGLRGLGTALRAELADTGIQVSTILSGPVETSFIQHAANFTGRGIERPNQRLSAEAIAKAVVGCVEHPRPEVVVPGKGGGPGLNRHEVAPHEGALFEPAG